LLLVWLYRLFPSILDAIIIVQPETVIRWHRRGFRAYWRWKSRHVGGHPRIDSEIRALIRRMSRDNPLWGAPRIHGELLMLGIEVAESTVARYMIRRRRPPSQGWKTFLRNHIAGIASLDLFVVRTISFKLLYGLVILRHARRRLVTRWSCDPPPHRARRITPRLAQRERAAKIPGHGAQNQLRCRLPPLEDCRPGCVLQGLFRLPTTPTKVATHPSQPLRHRTANYLILHDLSLGSNFP
jgi:hypothetical protein